jgi:hypothetical protein
VITMTKYLNRIRAFFSSEARTVGLSPKALAPLIGAGITAGLAALGITPHDIGNVLGVSDSVVAAGEVTVAAKLAAYLLGPGSVVVPPPALAAGNDARLGPEARSALGLDAEPRPPLPE